MLSRSRFVALSLLPLFLFACQTRSPRSNFEMPSEINIVGGTETNEYKNVGIMIGYNQFCTATLISPKVVLTAAHCVHYLRSPGYIDSATFTLNGINHRAKILPHPDYKQEIPNKNDLALLFLESAISDVTPALIASEQPKASQVAELVGFGADGQSAPTAEMPQGSPTGDGYKRVVSIPINEVSSMSFKFVSEKSTWHGDSGGPSFTRAGDELVLSGVHATAEINAWSVDINVATYCQWIKDSTAGHPLRIQSGSCKASAAALVNAR